MSLEFICGDCLDWIPKLPSFDLVVTSPPYGSLRNYNNSYTSFKFEEIAKALVAKMKVGAVIVWVCGDQTIKGSETGTSFKQALYFKSLGLNLHDTMIFSKKNYMPLNHRRYEQQFEYMFVFSKGKPKVFDPIKVPCKFAGSKNFGTPKYYKTASDSLTATKPRPIKSTKIKGNIWEYRVGKLGSTAKYTHPAMYPLELAEDHISSWSEEGDLVLDPFMGAGTTGKACQNLNRDFIGIEIERKYFEMARKRLDYANI